MKTPFALAALLWSSLAVAASGIEWRIEAEGEEYLAVSENLGGLKLPLRFEILAPRVVSWAVAPKNPDVWLLTYEADGSGTQDRFRETRAIVIDLKAKRVFGDYLVEARNQAGSVSLAPKWNWEKKKLRIEDLAFGDSRDLKF